MKRLLMLGGLMVLAVAILTYPTVTTADSPKATICHFDQGGDVGHVIEVSCSSLDAHLENHGDVCTTLPVDAVCTTADLNPAGCLVCAE